MGSKITGERRRIPLRLLCSKGLSASTKAHFRKPKTVPMPVPRGCVRSHPLLPRVIMTEREHRSTKTGCISLASNAENLMKWTLLLLLCHRSPGELSGASTVSALAVQQLPIASAWSSSPQTWALFIWPSPSQRAMSFLHSLPNSGSPWDLRLSKQT